MEHLTPQQDSSEHQEGERLKRVSQLIDGYQAERATLLAQQREVAQLREAVRAAAEQEASELLLAARREIRDVLVRTRRELLVLAAQLQAVGCESPAVNTASDAEDSGPDGPLSRTQSMVVGARRDVRDVLMEARAELAKLSDDARHLRVMLAETPTLDLRASATGKSVIDELLPPTGEEAFTVGRAARGVWADAPPPSPKSAPPLVISGVLAAAATLIALFLWWQSSGPGIAGPQADAPSAAAPDPGAGVPSEALVPQAAIPGGGDSNGTGRPWSLVVETLRPAWVRINVDGRSDPGRIYPQGERREIRAARDVVIRAGDAGAVLVAVGEEALSPLGRDGQVLTRRFGVAPEHPIGAEPAQTPVPAPVPPSLPHFSAPPPATPAEPGAAVSASLPQSAETGARSTSERVSDGPAAETLGPETTAPFEPSVADVRQEILSKHQQWLEAYHRDDELGMRAISTPNFSLVDERPFTSASARGALADRTVEDVRIEVQGIGAVLSGRLAESTAADGAGTSVLMLSEVWVRQENGWRLMGVRIVPADEIVP